MPKEKLLNSHDRRQFILRSLTAGAGLSLAPASLAASTILHERPQENAISLATWSIVRSFRAGLWKLTDVARLCREDFGLDGIEYVTAFFEVPVESYLKRLNQAANQHGVQNVLIMVDGEGDMVARDRQERMQAAINHRKWVEIAAYLGCHAIRCNARGGGESPQDDPDALDRAAEAFNALLEYAKEFEINVVIENHGGISSNPHWLPALMKKVDSPHFGTLPDYGNFVPTDDADVYEAVRLAMPYAKGVSVKTRWLPDGTHPGYDPEKLLQISVDSGYTGFWGIESSTGRSPEDQPQSLEAIKQDDWQAVLWTKRAIEKVVFGKTA